MTITVDSYSKKTTAYYILLIILFAPIILFVICFFSNAELSEANNRLIGFGFAVAVALYLSFRNSFIKMYIKDGEVFFTNDTITLKAFPIPITNIKKLVFRANDYKGNQKGTSDGSGNFVEVYTKDDKVYAGRFVIASWSQKDDIARIADQWRENGVFVTSSRL